jgi:predicted acetyltransferase
MVYSFKKVQESNWIKNDMILNDFVYEIPDALHGLLAFLRTQADQIHRILFATQDDTFHHLLLDPRDGTDTMLVLLAHEVNVEGVGIMYRVIDTLRLIKTLKDHDFNGQSCIVTLTIEDDFLPENSGSVTVQFNKGKPKVISGVRSEVEIIMNIADFSSLIMGVIDLSTLYNYGKVEISKQSYLGLLDQIFFSKERPFTTTQF